MAERDAVWTRDGLPVEELPDPFTQPTPSPEASETVPPRRRRWPVVLYSIAAVIFLTVLWLVITAPLSRALEPLEDPALLLTSDDGRPIALRGKRGPLVTTVLTIKASMLTALHTRPAGNGTG